MNALLNDLASIKALADSDVLDAVQQQNADKSSLLAHARKVLAQDEPALPTLVYPIEALGPLAAVCRDVAEHGQVRPAMVGNCLLGAASLLTQGLHNVETLGGPKPLSLYLITLGESGDGKSTANDVACKAVHARQRLEGEDYRAEMKEHRQASKKGKPGSGGEAAAMPRSPYRLVRDATVEGLRRDLENGPTSQGVFTDEAAAILAGYGMSAEHRAKTSAVFSGLWDNGHLSVSRASGERVEKYGSRLAVHWLIQPVAARESVSDRMLSQLGFWPRFLTALPEPLAPRVVRTYRPYELPSVQGYLGRCNALLDAPLPDDANEQPVIPLSADARKLLGTAFERFERAGRLGALRSIKPFAMRAAEQAARVAGVLAAFGGESVVSVETMRGALAIVSHSLDTWQSLIDVGALDETSANALRLYEWLVDRDGMAWPISAITNGGPLCVRSKDRRDAALDLLVQRGVVELIGGKTASVVRGAA